MKHEEVEREVNNLSHKKGRRRGIGMSKRKLIGVFFVLGIFLIASVSAAYLTHFGVSKAELHLDQSVVTNGLTWQESNAADPTIFEGYTGCCYGIKDKILNRACVGGTLVFEDTVNWQPIEDLNGEVTATHYIVPGWTTLLLENKDTSWDIIDDDISVELKFNPCCPSFVWSLEGKVTQINTEYVLIYYADQPDRFVNWGNAPLLLATVTSDSQGYILDSGNTGLGNVYFPFDDDKNIDPATDYTATDGYVHSKGAKIWLIPAVDYDPVNGVLLGWNPATYLFETDLVFYFDCDLEPPYWDFDILDCVLGAPLDLPFQYYIESKEEICLITYWCVDWASSGGIFSVKTYINPLAQ